jgi:uncharacterized phiE125 gp8 family phage protein
MRMIMTVSPTAEPVTLAEAKAHLRVDTSADDALITSEISAAREFVERWIRRALPTQTWQMILDKAPAGFDIPMPPLQEVTKIETIDDAGTKAEVSPSLYMVDLGQGSNGRVQLKSGCSWPQHRGFASFIVTFKCGYAEGVPSALKEAVLKLVALFYENRDAGESLGAVMNDPQPLLMQLLLPFKTFMRPFS